jgi:CRISPR-associated protein Cmr5
MPGTEVGDMRTFAQKRAEVAWACIAKVKDPNNKINSKEYRSRAEKLPAMLKINGLGQTLAFLISKDGVDKTLYDHLSRWLTDEKNSPLRWVDSANQPLNGEPKLIARVQKTTSLVYRQATEEALAFVGWLKRFAAAELGA